MVIDKATPKNIFNKSFDFLGENIEMEPPAPSLKLGGLTQSNLSNAPGIGRESVVFTPALNFFSNYSPSPRFPSDNSKTNQTLSSKKPDFEEDAFNLADAVKAVKPSPQRGGRKQSTGSITLDSDTKKNQKASPKTISVPSLTKGKTNRTTSPQPNNPKQLKDSSKPLQSSQINANSIAYPNFANLADFLARFFKSENIEASSVDLKPFELSILKSFIARKFNKSIKSK